MSKFLTLEGVPSRRASLMDAIITGLGETPVERKTREDAFVASKNKEYLRAYEDYLDVARRVNDDGARERANRLHPMVSYQNIYGDPFQERYVPKLNHRGEVVSSNVDHIFREQFQEAEKGKAYESHVTSMYSQTSGEADPNKLPSNLPRGAGYAPQGASLFASYGMGAFLDLGESLADDGLGFSFGGFIKRAFTPPRAIRKTVARMVKPPQFIRRAFTPPKVIRKGLRYAGAAAMMTLLPGVGFFMGRQRNKMFGLKGGEQKTFDAAAKIGRAGTIAVATVVGGAAVAPALGFGSSAATTGAMSSSLATASGGASTAAAGGWAAPTVGQLSTMALSTNVATAGTGVAAKAGLAAFLKTGGAFVVKKLGSDAVWKVAATVGGQLIASKFNRSQVPPDAYAQLPNDQFVPIPPPSAGGGEAPLGGGYTPDAQGVGIQDQEVAPSVAGSSAYEPGEGVEEEPLLFGEQSPVSDADREANSSPNPLDDSEENSRVKAFDDSSLADLTTDSPVEDLPVEDLPVEEPGTDDFLSCEFDRALGQVRARQSGRAIASRRRVAPLWGTLGC